MPRLRQSRRVAYTQDHGPPLYYELTGDPAAPVLVMIRGLSRTLRHWPEPLLAALKEHFRLLLFDNRGVGRSRSAHAAPQWAAVLRQPLTTTSMANDVVRVMAAAGVERAHVFGMSLGGMAAQQFALRHRARLMGLVLGCTSCGGWQAQRPRLDVMLSLAKGRLTSQRAAIEAEAAVQLSAGYRQRHPEVVDAWQRLAMREPTAFATILAQVAAGMRHNTRAQLPRLKVPTLVMTSDQDRLMPPSNSVTLVGLIAAAELFWVPGAGHDYVTEQPERCARAISRFLHAAAAS